MKPAGLLLVVSLVAVCSWQGSLAQQEYKSGVYKCTNARNKTCSSYVIYRTRGSFVDIPFIANLFKANESEIARLNPVDRSLYLGEPLVIPVTCRCVNASSTAIIKYVIQKGDTFWLLSTNTFDGLATTNAIIEANNETKPTELDIGQVVNIPLRCACPSVAQTGQGYQSLVTYTIQGGDTLSGIGALFAIDLAEIRAANGLDGNSVDKQETLVIPCKESKPTLRAFPPPPPAPVSDSGSDPAPEPTVPIAEPSGKSSTNFGLYIGIGVGVLAAISIVAGLCACLFIVKRKRRMRAERGKGELGQFMVSSADHTSRNDESHSVPISDNTPVRKPGGDPLLGMFDVMDTDKPAVYSYDDIKDATNNFAHGNIIQGSVYRGVLRGEVVAIKQMKGTMSEELKILCRVHHKNLVKLVGICVTEAEHLYLVYEYAENGSLSDCLHSDFLSRSKTATPSSSFLGWTVRVQIALDVATGLEYIHDYINPSYVHKDVKSSNVLLDGIFRAKIANFAMAKSGGSNGMMTRHIAGTYGYMAPEYLAHGLVTTKADVFAFGVMLLELLSAQEAILDEDNGQEKCLYSCVGPLLDGDDQTVKGKLRKWMDPALQNNYPLDVAQELASLAKSCVDPDPAQRPGMKDITYSLSKLLTASLEWESSAVFAHALMDTPIEAR